MYKLVEQNETKFLLKNEKNLFCPFAPLVPVQDALGRTGTMPQSCGEWCPKFQIENFPSFTSISLHCGTTNIITLAKENKQNYTVLSSGIDLNLLK
jgi:hypothetical protein